MDDGETSVEVEIVRMRPKTKWYVDLADFANMVKAFIGSNYLSVAYAFHQCGLLLGIGGMLLIAGLTDHGCHLLGKTKHHIIEKLVGKRAGRVQEQSRRTSYNSNTPRSTPRDSGMEDGEESDAENSALLARSVEERDNSVDSDMSTELEEFKEHMMMHMTYGDVGKYCFGNHGIALVNFFIALTQFGFCVAYFIFIGNTVHSLFKVEGHVANNTHFHVVDGNIETNTTILTTLVTFPNGTTTSEPPDTTLPMVLSHAPDLRLMVASPLPLFIFFALIRSVRYLGIISVVANICILLGCISVLSFILSGFYVSEGIRYAKIEGFPVFFGVVTEEKSLAIALVPLSFYVSEGIRYAKIEGFPVFFGMVTASFEGIGLVIPVESSMVGNRQLFSCFLHGALAILTLILGSFGTLGYLRYGNDVAQMLNANIPPSNPLAMAVNVLICIGILLTFPLQMFPVIEISEKYLFTEGRIFGPKKEEANERESLLIEDELEATLDDDVAAHVPDTVPNWKRNILRIVLVLIACGLAILLQNFFAYVGAFVGAVGSCVLGFVLPSLFHYKVCGSDVSAFIRGKDIFIVAFGVLASITSVASVIERIASGTIS